MQLYITLFFRIKRCLIWKILEPNSTLITSEGLSLKHFFLNESKKQDSLTLPETFKIDRFLYQFGITQINTIVENIAINKIIIGGEVTAYF